MTPNERITARAPGGLREVRRILGEIWGLGRALTLRELGEALELAGTDPGRAIQHLEHHPDKITGPVSVAVRAMLDGWLPDTAPDGAEAACDAYFAALEDD